MTTLDTAPGRFPETTWGLVRRLRTSTDDERRITLDLLARRYWKPVYSYLRATTHRPSEDLKDITQAFFLWLLQEDVLARYSPDRGSLRAYLKALLHNFHGNRIQAARALKRGGGIAPLSLAEAATDDFPDAQSPSPEESFDRSWISELIRRATDRVRQDSLSGDSQIPWRVFEAYDLRSGAEQPTYEEVAKRLDLKVSDVRNHLGSMRRRIRQLIQEELRDTVGSDSELQEEWNALFGS